MADKGNKPRRRILQFSLRTLFLLVLVLCGLLTWKIDKVKKQRSAVAWVREMGGSALYGYEVNGNGEAVNNPQPPGPAWLIDQLSIDFLDEVESVNLRNDEFDDLTPLQGLTGLRWLYLGNTDVSDLSPLARLTDMRDLELSGTKVTDLSPLTGMTNLRRLHIDHTPVSDVSPLAELTNLIGLYGRFAPISDLSPLAANTGMRSIDLTGTPVSDISPLAGMKRLEKLDLRATAVADLSPLAGMKNLSHIDLFDTPVTDLSPLAEATKLGIELGGSSMINLLPLVGMQNARISLYKYPSESVPWALESRLQQVRIVPIYKRHDE